VNNGSPCYYVIAAVNQSGTSANSGVIAATPVAAGALPAGWSHQDIGTVASAGSASYAAVGNNTFVVSGNGSDIGGTADSCSFAYMMVTNNFTFTARLLVNGSIKVGVMMRETLDADARTLTITLGETGARESKFRTRSSAGGAMSTQTGNDYTWTPVWYRLQRVGNVFTASQSLDGATWFVVGSSTVAMTTNYFAGLAVVGSTATFDSVTMSGAGGLPAVPTGLNAAPGNKQVGLTWNASTGAASYNVKRASISGGPYSTIASNLAVTSLVDVGLVNGFSYYYVVSAVNTNGESADAVEVVAVPSGKLTGLIIGTPGSYNNGGNTIAKVFDGDLNTFFDGPNSSNGSNCWAGLDFGSGVANVVTQIKYCPRSGYASRMIGGVFQGANIANFSDALALFTVTNQPTTGILTSQSVNLTNAFRYVRYLSPIGGWGNVAEVEFSGYAPISTTPVNMAFAVAGDQLHLSWPVDHTGWRLETQTNTGDTGLGSNWVTVPTSSGTNAMWVSIDANSGNVFFRLAYP
jgi:hypothetical protein